MNEQLATFAAAVRVRVRVRRNKQRDDPRHASDLIQEMYKAAFKMRLLMNRRDQNYDELEALLSLIGNLSSRAGRVEDNRSIVKALKPHQKRLLEMGNLIAKNEWEKTKNHFRNGNVIISALGSVNDRHSPSTTWQQIKPSFVRLNDWFNSLLPCWLRDPENR